MTKSLWKSCADQVYFSYKTMQYFCGTEGIKIKQIKGNLLKLLVYCIIIASLT